jgi:hypothetical protein
VANDPQDNLLETISLKTQEQSKHLNQNWNLWCPLSMKPIHYSRHHPIDFNDQY